jgi:hypothetical protein
VTERTAARYRSAGRAKEASGWAVGFMLFAGLMMITAGIFQASSGLVALFENEFYVATRNYLLSVVTPGVTDQRRTRQRACLP